MDFVLLPLSETLTEIIQSVRGFLPFSCPEIKSREIENSSKTILIHVDDNIIIWAFRKNSEFALLNSYVEKEFNDRLGIHERYWSVRYLSKNDQIGEPQISDIEILSKYEAGKELCRIYEEGFVIQKIMSSQIIILSRRALISLRILNKNIDFKLRKFKGRLLNVIHDAVPLENKERNTINSNVTAVIFDHEKNRLTLLDLCNDLKIKGTIIINAPDFIFNKSNIKKEKKMISLSVMNVKYVFFQRLERLIVIQKEPGLISGSFTLEAKTKPLPQSENEACYETTFFSLKKHIFLGKKNANNGSFAYMFELLRNGKKNEAYLQEKLREVKQVCGFSGSLAVIPGKKTLDFLVLDQANPQLEVKKALLETAWNIEIIKLIPPRLENYLNYEDKLFLIDFLCGAILESGFQSCLLRTTLLFFSLYAQNLLFHIYRFLNLFQKLTTCSKKIQLNIDVGTMIWEQLPITSNSFPGLSKPLKPVPFLEVDLNFLEDHIGDLDRALLGFESHYRVFISYMAIKVGKIDFIGRMIDLLLKAKGVELPDSLLEYLNKLVPKKYPTLILTE